MQSTKQAIFELGEMQFGLDIMNVITIEKGITVQPIPNSAKSIRGVISLRGDIIPVYDLRSKFALQEKIQDDETRFIITTIGGTLVAFEVDKILQIIEIEPDQQKKVPTIIEGSDTAYINSVVNLNGKLIYLLNNEMILTSEEQDKVKKTLKVALNV